MTRIPGPASPHYHPNDNFRKGTDDEPMLVFTGKPCTCPDPDCTHRPIGGHLYAEKISGLSRDKERITTAALALQRAGLCGQVIENLPPTEVFGIPAKFAMLCVLPSDHRDTEHKGLFIIKQSEET